MDPKNLARLEALFFIHGEPLRFEKIGKILGIPAEEVPALVGELERRLASEDRGLILIRSEGDAQLATKPEFAAILEGFIKEELAEDLSPASLETLAIIAYFGPISRTRIDYQRGVNSNFILRSLLLRGLVERSPDPGRPASFLYKPSFNFFRHLGVAKAEDLPDFEKFRGVLENFEREEAAQS